MARAQSRSSPAASTPYRCTCDTLSVRPARATSPTALSRCAVAGLRKLILYSAVSSHWCASINVAAAPAPGRVGDGAEEPAVKEAVLLRELAAEVRGNHAPPRRDLLDPRVDMAQEALTREGVPDAVDIVRIADAELFGRHIRRHGDSSCRLNRRSRAAARSRRTRARSTRRKQAVCGLPNRDRQSAPRPANRRQ